MLYARNDADPAWGADAGGNRVSGPPGSFAAVLTGVLGEGRPWSQADAPEGPWPERPLDVFVCGHATRSQYDVLRETVAAGGGLPGPVACLAGAGAGFHGQHGRAWRAETGNLHLSYAWPCDLPHEASGPALPMLATVAVCEALARVAPPAAAAAGIKWINDIVVDGAGGEPAKLGGVLTAVRASAGRITEVFGGVGVNVAAAPPVADTATVCLADFGAGGLGVPALAGAVLAAVERLLAEVADSGTDALAAAYAERSVLVGRDVEVDTPQGMRRGRVRGVSRTLELLLDDGGGPITDGRVVGVEPGA